MRLCPPIRTTAALLASLSLTRAFNDTIQVAGVEWDDDNWVLQTQTLQPGIYQSRMSLANGYLGINLAAVGPFFEVDAATDLNKFAGWPLFDVRQTFATVAGFYDNQDPIRPGTNYPWLDQYGGESFISGIPHWAGLVIEANGAVLNASVSPEHVSKFSTSLDIRAGVMRWSFTWTAAGGHPIDVEYEMFVHKLYVNRAAVQVKLSASRDINVKVYDIIDGASAVRTDFVGKGFKSDTPTVWTAVSPIGVPNVTAYIYSTLRGSDAVHLDTRAEVTDRIYGSMNASSIAQSVQVKLAPGRTAEVSKFVGIASSDAFAQPETVARTNSIEGASAGYADLLRTHKAEWASILPRDSVDRYYLPNGSLPTDSRLRELQVLSVTNPFHLLQHTVGTNAIAQAGNNPRLNINSISVCGLGSDCYGGLIFWDAESWMAMGLQSSHPQHIESVVNYRVEKHAQAKKNVGMAFASSKNQTGRFTGGAVYPWTSGRYGNCTGCGPCFDYEYHVNGDVGIAFRNQLAATGDFDTFTNKYLPIANDIAYFYGEVLDLNKTSGYYELFNATDPDEYANNVNNVGYTTALIQKHFEETNGFNSIFGWPPNVSWTEKLAKMRLPVNEEAGIVMEYDTMNGTIVVKQADVILTDDILHYSNPYSLANLDYYANKQSADGPGMTYAAFSIVANEISPSGCSSYTYDALSSSPYLRAPWFQYSEQLVDDTYENGGTHPAFPFLTGQGGANRIGVFGYLGLRLFWNRLDVDPSLPPQIEHINYRAFYWQGYGIDARSNATHTELTRIPNRYLPSVNKEYIDKPIPVTLGTRAGRFLLEENKTLVISNRMLGQTPTAPGNILQCKPVVKSEDDWLPREFPLAAIDGASSTRWQPDNATRLSYLSVDLGSEFFVPIKAVNFDWASEPPVYYEVFFTNSSLPPFTATSDIRNVTSGFVNISEPFDPAKRLIVQQVRGNWTNITLAPNEKVWSGRYAHLGILGNLKSELERQGGMVAEWNLIRDDGVDELRGWRDRVQAVLGRLRG